jgi:hypothetical protein
VGAARYPCGAEMCAISEVCELSSGLGSYGPCSGAEMCAISEVCELSSRISVMDCFATMDAPTFAFSLMLRRTRGRAQRSIREAGAGKCC